MAKVIKLKRFIELGRKFIRISNIRIFMLPTIKKFFKEINPFFAKDQKRKCFLRRFSWNFRDICLLNSSIRLAKENSIPNVFAGKSEILLVPVFKVTCVQFDNKSP